MTNIINKGFRSILFCSCLFLLLTSGIAKAETWIASGINGRSVSSLVIDPSNPSIIYAVADGQFFKSIDGGISWTHPYDGLELFIIDLIIDPSDTSIIYAGTYQRGGIFKSITGGDYWSKIASWTNWGVQTLAIDPSDTSVIYAGVIDAGAYTYYGSVLKSINGGTTWEGLDGDTTESYISDLVIDPYNTSVIYAGTYGDGVFKSLDGGKSWTVINSGLTDPYIMELVISPSDSSIIYAATDGGGVFKSLDGGASWMTINSGLTNTWIKALAIDPSNTSVIYAGTDGGGVFKSLNRGDSWTVVNNGLTDPYIRDLVIDPSNTSVIYAGSCYGGGVFKSLNGGVSWTAVNGNMTGAFPPAGLVRSLAIDPSEPSTIYAVVLILDIDHYFGYYRLFKSLDGGRSWTILDNDLGSLPSYVLSNPRLVIDPTVCSTIYAGTGEGVLKSLDGGGSWTVINNGLTNVYVQDIVVDPVNASVFYVATGDGVFRSIDGGGNWTATNNGLTNIWVTTLAIDPSNTSVIYAGTDSAGVYKSFDGGDSWTRINSATVSFQDLVIDPSDASVIYAGAYDNAFNTAGGGIFKSINGGASWTAVNSGLTNLYVTKLVIDPSNTSVIYAGTDGGVFKSLNGGGSWSNINSGLADLHITDLVIDPSDTSVIYAGTLYRGVFKYGQSGPYAPVRIGVFDHGTWYLDINGSKEWDGVPSDTTGFFGDGLAGAMPVAGDWHGLGTTNIGVFADGYWYLDMNNNRQWDEEPADKMAVFGAGLSGAVPVAGDWDGNGTTEIGVFVNGYWYLDMNNNYQWDGELIDKLAVFGVGLAGAVPVAGDWTGNGITKIGVYIDGVWYLDVNGNGVWDGEPTDKTTVFGMGLIGAMPVTGDWNGDNISEIGIYQDGRWYLDMNNNGTWDGIPADSEYSFGGGQTGAVPVSGHW